MKKYLVFMVLWISMFPGLAQAAQTLDLEDEYRDGDGKTCIYSNGRVTVSVHKDGGGSCSSKYVNH